MLRNHAGYITTPSSRQAALEQYEWWKPTNRDWVRINTLDDDHINNLIDYFLRRAWEYAGYAGQRGLGTQQSIDWMRAQPLFVSLLHEKKLRSDRLLRTNQELERKIDTSKVYLFAPMGSRTDVVRVSFYLGKLTLNDAVTGMTLWSNVDLKEFLQRCEGVATFIDKPPVIPSAVYDGPFEDDIF